MRSISNSTVSLITALPVRELHARFRQTFTQPREFALGQYATLKIDERYAELFRVITRNHSAYYLLCFKGRIQSIQIAL